ncbi:Uncharacterized protein FWK35_00035542 [Aphis craccivora]|uniref:Uncharacterized protein n=1 Tax=Aphis craccivora TaxID=307492 RepID=A0A6G0VRW5_APHCR|nr:Uncharacterized protein FWK35_00035542 [Aphis craccivora]
MNVNETILNHRLGYIIKNGRFLSLKETHDSICNQNYDITYIHDAISDLILSKFAISNTVPNIEKLTSSVKIITIDFNFNKYEHFDLIHNFYSYITYSRLTFNLKLNDFEDDL